MAQPIHMTTKTPRKQVAPSPATQNRFLRTLIVLPTAAIILFTAWISGSAIIENLRFAKATGQILRVLEIARSYATSDKNFALTPGQDILNDLSHAGLLTGVVEGTPATMTNPWKQSFTVYASAPSMMRIEAHMPPQACRRLALFFLRDFGDLGLKIMETREAQSETWRHFMDRTNGQILPSNVIVEAVCGDGTDIVLAVVITLR
jgi:hypothetical protein